MSRFLTALIVVASLSTAAWAESRSVRSFAHSVTTTAARVEPPTGDKHYVSIRCWQASASPVYLGGKDVTPANGYAICTNRPGQERGPAAAAGAACQADWISLDVPDLYAVVSPPPESPASPGLQSLSCIIVQ
jgi:hypothetical protein